MVEPVTVNKALIIPNTGDLVDTWGSAAIVPDYVAIDGMLGGFVTVSLTNAPVTLSAPAGSVTPGPGPNQSQNSLIIFSGTLSGNCVVTFPLPGQYNILNSCVVGAFYVQLSGGAGNKIGIPPGHAVSVFSNGTDMRFISLPPVGSYWDYAGSTVPAWIGACTVAPWKVCDGTVLQISDWPQLYAIIGANYGGNGLTTFALPDLRNRYRIPLDTNQGGFSSRITAAVSGINGQTLGAAGGDQAMPTHTHGTTDPGHHHNFASGGNPLTSTSGSGSTPSTGSDNQPLPMLNAQTGITINNAGTGTGANIPPGLVAGLSFIRMG